MSELRRPDRDTFVPSRTFSAAGRMGDTAAAPAVDVSDVGEKRERTPSDMGELLNSPAAALMKLVDCDHLNDFAAVCEYLSVHAMEVSKGMCAREGWRPTCHHVRCV